MVFLAWHGHKTRAFLRAAVKTLFVAVLPLVTFAMSFALAPGAKSESQCGPLGSFQAGKIVLVPIALWATESLWVIEVLERSPPPRWAAWGIASGALVSAATLVVSVACFFPIGLETGSVEPALAIMLLFPAYVTGWYLWRARRLVRNGHLKTVDAPGLIAINAPFWLVTVVHTRWLYENLPDTPINPCFIVTAAARGHSAVVGPIIEIAPARFANLQLVRFWTFESHWRRTHPASHAVARRIYGRIGPWVAARIRTRWQADLVYLALKPLELAIRVTSRRTR